MISNLKQEKIINQAVSDIDYMLTIATTMKIQTYILEQQAENYRDFEASTFHLGFTKLTGTGIIATKAEIENSGSRINHEFFHDNVPLSNHQTSALINAFPLEAAVASYLFTKLEVFGDAVADIINPGGISQNKSWHEDIKGFADLKDPVQVEKAREAFGKHFQVDALNVPLVAAVRMVELKKLRNEFAHEGGRYLDFQKYLHDALCVMCHIVHLTTELDRISLYPFEDLEPRFEPRTDHSYKHQL